MAGRIPESGGDFRSPPNPTQVDEEKKPLPHEKRHNTGSVKDRFIQAEFPRLRKVANVAITVITAQISTLVGLGFVTALAVASPARIAYHMATEENASFSDAARETMDKTVGWAKDFRELSNHVSHMGEVFAPNKTFGSHAPVPKSLTDQGVEISKRTLYVGLPGFDDNQTSLNGMQEELRDGSEGEIQKGDFYRFNREMISTHSIESYAEDLANKLTTIAIDRNEVDGKTLTEDQRSRKDYSSLEPLKIVLDTHSMGGLIALELANQIQEKGLPIQITYVTFNGCPLKGSPAAAVGRVFANSTCAQQMDPNSDFIKSREGHESNVEKGLKALAAQGTKALFTHSEHDTMVPYDSAKGEDILPDQYTSKENHVTLKREGHVSMLHHQTIRDARRKLLSSAFESGIPKQD